jgi:hypothetical protein
MNNQRLDFDPSNYQNVSKKTISSKYANNTLVTCHFSIKKIKKLKKKSVFGGLTPPLASLSGSHSQTPNFFLKK